MKAIHFGLLGCLGPINSAMLGGELVHSIKVVRAFGPPQPSATNRGDDFVGAAGEPQGWAKLFLLEQQGRAASLGFPSEHCDAAKTCRCCDLCRRKAAAMTATLPCIVP